MTTPPDPKPDTPAPPSLIIRPRRRVPPQVVAGVRDTDPEAESTPAYAVIVSCRPAPPGAGRGRLR